MAIVGDLPSSSNVTRFMVAAPSCMICSPTATEPVKEIPLLGCRAASVI